MYNLLYCISMQRIASCWNMLGCWFAKKFFFSRGVSWLMDVPEHYIISGSFCAHSDFRHSIFSLFRGFSLDNVKPLILSIPPVLWKIIRLCSLWKCGFVWRCKVFLEGAVRYMSENSNVILPERDGALQFICKESELCSFNCWWKEWSVCACAWPLRWVVSEVGRGCHSLTTIELCWKGDQLRSKDCFKLRCEQICISLETTKW